MNIFQLASNLGFSTKYTEEPVDERMIGLALHMATMAASAGNLQEWEFVVVEENKTKQNLSSAAGRAQHIAKAPMVIVVCADIEKAALKYGKRGELVYALEDLGMAQILLLLTLKEVGLGFDMVRSFDEEDVKIALNLPDNLRPISLITVGFAAEEPKHDKRIPFENVTHVNRYGQKILMEFKPILNAIEDSVNAYKEKRRKQLQNAVKE